MKDDEKDVSGFRILAISAANITHQPRGSSMKMAEQVLSEVRRLRPDADTRLIALVDKSIEPCVGCGCCAHSHRCKNSGDDFDAIYRDLLDCDGLVVVTAHYAPIPAKLCAFMERVESISFLGWWNDPAFVRPLAGKPYAVVGHGGGTPETWNSYFDVIMTPIKNGLGFPVGMSPVDIGEWPHMGILVGPSEVKKSANSPFPVQVYDEARVLKEIRRVAEALVAAVEAR